MMHDTDYYISTFNFLTKVLYHCRLNKTHQEAMASLDLAPCNSFDVEVNV